MSQSTSERLVNVHWYFDSAPTKDIGITEKEIEKVGQDYIIGGIAGSLNTISSLYNELGLERNSVGRKFIKSDDNLALINQKIGEYVASRRLALFGTVFYHTRIPEVIRKNPNLYVDDDNPNERGIGGLRGRAFAQTIWVLMEPLKAIPTVNPIVWLDNEDKAIQDCISFHFYKQLKDAKPNAKFLVQSVDQAKQNEPKGHRLSDIICSVLREYIDNPNESSEINSLIANTTKYDSKLETVAFDGRTLHTNYQTSRVAQWDL